MRSTVIFLMLWFISISNLVLAQNMWMKIYGGAGHDEGAAVYPTNDNGFIVGGYTNSFGAGGGDVYLLKINSSGDTLWTKTYGGPAFDSVNDIEQTSDNGFIITGSSWSFSNGGADLWLLKTDANGDTSWTKHYGGNFDDFGAAVGQTGDGGYFIIGSKYISSSYQTNAWLVKTDASGNMEWEAIYGGLYNDLGFSGQQTSDGGYIIAGYYQQGEFSNADYWLVKTDANGDTSWTRTFGGDLDDVAYCVQQTADDGYILTGYSRGRTAGGVDIMLVKTDSNGDSVWSNFFGGYSWESANSVTETSDGGFLVCGHTYSYSNAGDADLWLIKTDSFGDSLWDQVYGGSGDEIGYDIIELDDHGFIISGFSSSYGNGNNDVLIMRTNADGITSVDDAAPAIISDFQLKQNFPNPFNPQTRIEYYLPFSGNVELNIFDVSGKLVQKPVDRFQISGRHHITFHAEDLSAGIYFYQLKMGKNLISKKMVFLK